MADIQQQEDVNQAKAKLEEVARQKDAGESRMDKRTGASLIRTERRAPGASPESRGIRPVTAKPQKKKFGQKLKEAMFGDIGDGSITEHIFFNIFIPSFKRVLSDMGNTALNMALGLDPKTRVIRSANTHTANASIYRDRNYSRNDGGDSYARRSAVCDYEWDEETAKDIYTQLSDLIEKYGRASLADAYTIMGMENKIRSTDGYWGWTSMRNAEVYAVDSNGDRWIVNMPPVKPF